MTPGVKNSLPHPELEISQLDIRPYWHQLLVIGNGFDLECGLPSKYEDFFKSRYPNGIKHATKLGCNDSFGQYRDDNMWNLAINGTEKRGWFDIEGTIAKWVGKKGGNEAYTCPKYLRELAECLNTPGRKLKAGDFRAGFEMTRRLLYKYPDVNEWKEENVLKAFREELRSLEDDFSAYLMEAVDELPTYKENAQTLAFELLKDEMPNKNDFKSESSILSFNYTNSFGGLKIKGHEVSVVNIHGRLGQEIVFGIDGTNIMDDPLRAPFSKTYRLMGLDVPETETIVQAASASATNRGTALIKFYGHSLGEPDYSYFQALFDTVDLYEANTKLIFYYRPHKDKDGNMGDAHEARISMMDKVVHLLNDYGKTLDNKDHGKNLIHKLLLEGRLSVRELPRTIMKKETVKDETSGVTFSYQSSNK